MQSPSTRVTLAETAQQGLRSHNFRATMSIDIQQFFQAINPARPLQVTDESDRRYYIDFSSVRGGEVIRKLHNRIANLSPKKPTCSLFTGHIGCGKTTELLRLQSMLEESGFFVVYIESSEDLELADVDIIDVLLAIARRIAQELDTLEIEEPQGFKRLLQQTWEILQTEIEVKAEVKAELPGLGKVQVNSTGATISTGIGAITVKAKNDATLRKRLNQYLGPQKSELLRLINVELLEPAIAELQRRGKQGLVAIVDNLDRIDNRIKSFARPQDVYLFVDQGDILNRLGCHVIYTMPLALRFSNEYGNLQQRFSMPQFLPMVRVKYRDGRDCREGIDLLKQMVLSRVFPDLSETERLARTTEVFDAEASLDRLCRTSGGHVRDLLQLLASWVEEQMDLPLTENCLEEVLANYASEMQLPISEAEWEKLRQVKATQAVSDEEGYEGLIRSRMVFEYYEERKSWFAVNPILADALDCNLKAYDYGS